MDRLWKRLRLQDRHRRAVAMLTVFAAVWVGSLVFQEPNPEPLSAGWLATKVCVAMVTTAALIAIIVGIALHRDWARPWARVVAAFMVMSGTNILSIHPDWLRPLNLIVFLCGIVAWRALPPDQPASEPGEDSGPQADVEHDSHPVAV